MKVVLSMRLGILNALFQDLLGLLDKLSVQVNGVCGYTAIGIVFAKDELRGLLVILFHFAPVGLALLRKLLGGSAIAARVGFLRLNQGVRTILSPAQDMVITI